MGMGGRPMDSRPLHDEEEGETRVYLGHMLVFTGAVVFSPFQRNTTSKAHLLFGVGLPV